MSVVLEPELKAKQPGSNPLLSGPRYAHAFHVVWIMKQFENWLSRARMIPVAGRKNMMTRMTLRCIHKISLS